MNNVPEKANIIGKRKNITKVKTIDITPLLKETDSGKRIGERLDRELLTANPDGFFEVEVRGNYCSNCGSEEDVCYDAVNIVYKFKDLESQEEANKRAEFEESQRRSSIVREELRLKEGILTVLASASQLKGENIDLSETKNDFAKLKNHLPELFDFES